MTIFCYPFNKYINCLITMSKSNITKPFDMNINIFSLLQKLMRLRSQTPWVVNDKLYWILSKLQTKTWKAKLTNLKLFICCMHQMLASFCWNFQLYPIFLCIYMYTHTNIYQNNELIKTWINFYLSYLSTLYVSFFSHESFFFIFLILFFSFLFVFI